MNQSDIGKFIARKRKEKNLTQEQFAERIGVTNKTVSKWECGKCMPDYSIIQSLCAELDVSLNELLDGKENQARHTDSHDDNQLLALLDEMQKIKNIKLLSRLLVTGIAQILLGILLLTVTMIWGKTNVPAFMYGFFTGMALGMILIGIFLTVFSSIRNLIKNCNGSL